MNEPHNPGSAYPGKVALRSGPMPGGPSAASRRRVRMTRETGQSLVLSSLASSGIDCENPAIEIRVSQICAGGIAILDVLLPDHMFVERKETMDGVHALFACRPAPLADTAD